LGYFLKINAYRDKYWDWLVAKITKRTGIWCNTWLTGWQIHPGENNAGGPVCLLDVDGIYTPLNSKENHKIDVSIPMEWKQIYSTIPPLQMGLIL